MLQKSANGLSPEPVHNMLSVQEILTNSHIILMGKFLYSYDWTKKSIFAFPLTQKLLKGHNF